MFNFRLNSNLSNAFQTLDSLHDFIVFVILLHPKSRGSVKLQSNNPLHFPQINPNLLSDPEDYDIETVYKGIQYVLKLNNTKAFRNYEAKLNHPAVPHCDEKYNKFSKDWWYCSIRTVTGTVSNNCITSLLTIFFSILSQILI